MDTWVRLSDLFTIPWYFNIILQPRVMSQGQGHYSLINGDSLSHIAHVESISFNATNLVHYLLWSIQKYSHNGSYKSCWASQFQGHHDWLFNGKTSSPSWSCKNRPACFATGKTLPWTEKFWLDRSSHIGINQNDWLPSLCQGPHSTTEIFHCKYRKDPFYRRRSRKVNKW